MKNEEAVNAVKLTEKRTADSTKRHWSKFIHNFLITFFEKKLLLSDTQIIIATMFNKQSILFSVSVLFISVLSSVYHLNLITLTLSSVLFFKISLISISDQFLYLLWDAVNCCPCVSVEEQNSSVNQIKNVWYISNESQLQLYA